MASSDEATPELVETFVALQTLLLTTEGIDSFLQEVAELAGQITLPSVSCGITAEYDGRPLTVASSDGRARALDESQYRLGEGTCLHAMRVGEVVDVPDTEVETRWPLYLQAAREQGLRSSLSLPLMVGNRSIGAVNVYCFDAKHDFDGETRRHADLFAAPASTALLLAFRQVKNTETTQQLENALSSRSVIDQALGIVMGQQRCSAEAAFALLRDHSQNNNKKLRLVAAELVARTSGSCEPPRA
jgi:GAF domain-containing protein